MSSSITPDPVGEQLSAEEEELRRKVERLRAHRSMHVACAIEMELSSGTPRRNLRRLALATSVGDNTIRDWMRGASTPTWDAIKSLVADLHPEPRLSDPLEWLLAGRAYLQSLVARLEELDRARLAGEIEAAAREELKEYDRQGRLWKVTEPSGAAGAGVTTVYSYDVGKRLSEASPTGGAVTQVGSAALSDALEAASPKPGLQFGEGFLVYVEPTPG